MFCLSIGLWGMWDLTPWPVVEPELLPWKQEVLNTGLPGEVPSVFILFSGKMREFDCLTQIKKNWSQINYFWIEDTKLLSLSSSKWIHLLWTTAVCIQSSLLLYASLHWQEARLEIRRHDPTCVCHHILVNYLVGLSFNIFKRKGRKRKRGKEKWMEGEQEKKKSHALPCIDYWAFQERNVWVYRWSSSTYMSVSFSCYIISSKVRVKYTKLYFFIFWHILFG